MLWFAASCLSAEVQHAICKIDNNVLSIERTDKRDGAVGWATWEDSIDEVGWFKFHVETDGKYTDNEQFRCAGALDGYLGQHRIFQRFHLYKDMMKLPRDEHFPEKWESWMTENLEFTRNSVANNSDDKYWQSLGTILSQYDGLVEGYNLAAPEEEKLRAMDLLFIQAVGDVYDLETVWDGNYNELHHLECSGLVALTENYTDLFFGQDAWSSYQKMHQVLKEYHINSRIHKAKRLTISTRMGALASSDDFWLTDAGLMVLETTNNNFNMSLYDRVHTKTILTWLRVLHATWFSDGAEEWTKEFTRLQSGTYNNQYVVVDSKKFVPGERPTKDLLWVVETMPGIERSADATELLAERRWFPSINTPWFEDIFNIAGYPEKIKEKGDLGDYYSYYDSARFKIFQREAPKVRNIEDFKRVMRFNRYKDDEFGHGDPGQMITARYDLRENCAYGQAAAFGGLDSKVASAVEALNNLSFRAIGSPEHEYNAPWAFGEGQFADVKYDGLPRVWDFDWINFSADNFSRCGQYHSREECAVERCGWCTFSSKCVDGTSAGPIGYKCEDGWQYYTPMQPWAVPVIAATASIVVVFVGVIYTLAFFERRKRTGNAAVYEAV